METRIPAFVFKEDPGQFGDGTYSMVACFPALGVHVPFTIYAHSENEYLRAIGEPTECDGSCESQHHGHLEDFSKEGHVYDYNKKPPL